MFACLVVTACSGGGGAAPNPPSNSPTPKGTATASSSPTHAPTSTPTATATPTTAPTGPAGLIKHVVIVIQENRSFDNLFQGFPGANTASSGVTSKGVTVALKPVGLQGAYDNDHSHLAFVRTYAGGKLYFDLTANGTTLNPYAYVPHAETLPYFTLGEKYVVADNMFQSNTGPSFVAHLYLIAGSSQIAAGQQVDENPDYIAGAWGCDQPAGVTADLLNPTTGLDMPGPFPCYNYDTLADELDAKSLSWKYYAPNVTKAPAPPVPGGIWSAYDAISHIRFGPDWPADVISPETTFLTDAPNGLPDVTWVVPSYLNSDHAGDGSATGPQWVTSVVNAIGTSPDWSSTAVFVLWDDWGGWFDHVAPPQIDSMGLGYRVPLMVISPYSKHGYVSHVQHEFGSILKFTEETFGLAPLAASDLRADDFSDCFDFGQAPQPFVRLRTTLAPSYFLQAKPDSRPPDDD